MKLPIAIISFVLLLLLPESIYCQESNRSTKFINGYKFTFTISEKDLQDLPAWNPETEDAPLSIHKAVVTARKNIDSLFPEAKEEWYLNDVNLSELVKGKWYYKVEFVCSSEQCAKPDSDNSFLIFVKMDGAISKLEIEFNGDKPRIY